MALLPVEDALARILGSTSPVTGTEDVTLHHAGNRVLAAPVAARLTQPPFDASAMDGYAVRGADVSQPGAELVVIGESAAGHRFHGTVGARQCVRIFTGAPVPDGADTVLLQEDTEKLEGGRIRSTFAPPTGRHIRPRGQDFLVGEAVLAAGQVLDPGRLTVAAAMNHDRVTVWRKPVVVLIATGDELRQPGSDLLDSQIIASNTFGVAELARQAGAEVIDLGIVADDRQRILEVVSRAQSLSADVIVTLGGASVGDYDLVQSTMLEAGMTLDFWRIAMRPGKPLMVGDLGTAKVLGLPGNPVSAMVCALLFMEPMLRKMARLARVNRQGIARTLSPLKANDQRQDYLRAQLSLAEDGSLQVSAFDKQDSSMMKIFAGSDALLVRPPHAPAEPAGSLCPVMILRQPGS